MNQEDLWMTLTKCKDKYCKVKKKDKKAILKSDGLVHED